MILRQKKSLCRRLKRFSEGHAYFCCSWGLERRWLDGDEARLFIMRSINIIANIALDIKEILNWRLKLAVRDLRVHSILKAEMMFPVVIRRYAIMRR